MSERLTALNYDAINVIEQSTIDGVDVAVGANVVTLDNEAGFIVGKFIAVGTGEQTEVKQINSITGKIIQIIGTFEFKHMRGERVLQLVGNTLRFYRAANVNGSPPPDSSFSVLGVPVNIQSDQLYTEMLDSVGGASYWYKYIYLDSYNNDSTAIEDSIAIRGGDFGHIVSISQIRVEAGMEGNDSITDASIAFRRAQSESLVKGTCASVGYQMPFQDNNGNFFVPEVIELATLLIAAGYVLSRDFGDAASDIVEQVNKDGRGKIKQGNDILTQISNNKILLLDSNDQPLIRTTEVSGWPDDTTEIAGFDGLPQPFLAPLTKIY